MKRRDFLHLGVTASAVLLALRGLGSGRAWAADKPGQKGAQKLKDSDILKDGEATTIANYCSEPEKQPNKYCPGWKDKPGKCEKCMFFNKDNSLTDYKGGKYARCQLLTTPGKAQFVSVKGWCATYVAKS